MCDCSREGRRIVGRAGVSGNESKQVYVVDFSDPNAPRVASTIPLDHHVSDVVL